MHARIDVPLHLVLSGARHLKKLLFQLILEQQWASEAQALRLASETMDLAMEIMSHAYSRSHDRNSRNEEGYRLFSVLQNISTERERQRGALLDWENSLMFDLAMGSNGVNLPRLAASDFGLWFRHKGAYAFQNTSESDQILKIIRHMDDVLLPMFLASMHEQETRMRLLRDIRDQTKSLMFNLDNLFNTANELESGRDVLTRMLNRKFLPVVIGNEIAIAQKTGQTFSVFSVDIDNFKSINDNFGHEAGDAILQQIAEILSSHSRAGTTCSAWGRGVPDDPGGHRQRQRHEGGAEVAAQGRSGKAATDRRPQAPGHREHRHGHLQRPPRLPAPAATGRPGHVPGQAGRPNRVVAYGELTSPE